MSFWNGTAWVSETPEVAEAPPTPERPSRVKRLGGAVAEGALIAALTFGLIAGSAFAAKGGGKPGGGGGGHHGTSTTSTLRVVMVEDANGNGSPNWNDTITYNVTSTSSSPFVSTRCYQGGSVVFAADAGFYADYPWPGARNMPLYSPSWTGGSADCKAYVNDVLTLTFQVGA